MNEGEYERIAAVADEHWWYRSLFASVLAELPGRPDASVLDIGAGTGAMLRAVRDAHPAHRIAGVEPSPRGREVAARGGISLADGSYDDYGPHESERFDAILALDSLYYLRTDARIVGALGRVRDHLADDGVFIGQVAAFESLAGAHDAWVDCHRRFRGDELERLFADAGLTMRWRYRYQLLAPAVFASRRIVERLRPRPAESDVALPNALVNGALLRLSTWEDALTRHLPSGGFGSSVFWVAHAAR